MRPIRENLVIMTFLVLNLFINCESRSEDYNTIKSEIGEAVKSKVKVILVSSNKTIAQLDLSDKNNNVDIMEDVIILSVLDKDGSGEKYYLPYKNILYLSWRIEPLIEYNGKLMSHYEAIKTMEENRRPQEEMFKIEKMKGVPHKHELLIKIIQ